MKRIALSSVLALMIAGPAAASSFTFSLPDLWFPPTDDATVSKTCIESGATEDCPEEE